MSKHTAGPWKILDSSQMTDDEYDDWIGNKHSATLETIWDGKIMIAEACAWDDEMSEQSLKANARLIAAAPDLLEALEYCRQKIAYMTTHGEWYSPGQAIEKADAALSKARGEG